MREIMEAAPSAAQGGVKVSESQHTLNERHAAGGKTTRAKKTTRPMKGRIMRRNNGLRIRRIPGSGSSACAGCDG
jgi:hypothetical protein